MLGDSLFLFFTDFTIGKAAAIVEVFFFVPYLVSILCKKTRPHRVTWWIVTVVAFVMATSNDEAAGNPDTRWLAWAFFGGQFAVALLSIPFGVGGWKVEDKKQLKDQNISIIGAVIGIVFLFILEHPFLALLTGIIADYFGFRLTIKKARDKPHSESRLAWTITFVANILGIFAIGEWPSWPITLTFVTVAIFPLYMLIVNSLVTFWLYFSPHRRHT
ncbi:MAG: hypothetical protein Q8R36_04130 [bacterium]|nr:hypothetical protein [bacterium]